MRINFNKTVKTFKGEDMIDASTKGTLTLRDLVCGSLFLCPENTPAEDKYSAWKLIQKINVEGEVEITTEEGSLIKKICSLRCCAGVYGQLVDIIEGKE